MVYNSTLFSSPLVLLSNQDLRGFRLPRFFMCPHINSVNQGMPVYNLIKTQLVEILSVIAFLLFFHKISYKLWKNPNFLYIFDAHL